MLCYSGCARLGFTGCLSCHARVGKREKASAKSSTIDLFVAQCLIRQLLHKPVRLFCCMFFLQEFLFQKKKQQNIQNINLLNMLLLKNAVHLSSSALFKYCAETCLLLFMLTRLIWVMLASVSAFAKSGRALGFSLRYTYCPDCDDR